MWLCLACSGGLRWNCFLMWMSIVFLLVRWLCVGWKSRKGEVLNPERVGVSGSGRCGVGGTGARSCDSLCCLGVGGVKYAFIPDAHLFLFFLQEESCLVQNLFLLPEKNLGFLFIVRKYLNFKGLSWDCNFPKSQQGALNVALFWPQVV